MTDNTKYEVTLDKRAQQLGEWFAEYAAHHRAKAKAMEALPGSDAWVKVERNLERARFAYALQDDIADRLTSQPAQSDLVEKVRRIARTAEMSAGIMRDAKRTGGWQGAENTARAFDRLSGNAWEVHAALSTPTAPQPDRESVPTYKTMAELRAQRADPAADLYERFPELRRWQQDRSEWHDETILEIVSEFIEWQRAAPTTDTQSDAVRGHGRYVYEARPDHSSEDGRIAHMIDHYDEDEEHTLIGEMTDEETAQRIVAILNTAIRNEAADTGGNDRSIVGEGE